MRASPDTTSLVLLGAWNPGILQPNWLARHAFNRPTGEDIQVTVAFSMTPGLPPRFTMEGLTFTPSLDRLVITSTTLNLNALNTMEEKAISILETLPHTPVSAFGENFELIDEHPTPALLNIFELNDALADHINTNYDLVTTDVRTSLRVNNCTLNLARQFSTGVVKFKFNFHYDTTSASDAAEKLHGSYSQNLEFISNFLATYNTAIDNNEEVTHDGEEHVNT